MTQHHFSRAPRLVSVSIGLRASTARTPLCTPLCTPLFTFTARRIIAAPTTQALLHAPPPQARPARPAFLSTTASRIRGILPDSENPSPPDVADHAVKAVPANLTDDEYHELSDACLEAIQSELEAAADKTEGVEFEYSAGVLTFTVPEVGTYVINKQPPNRQIWLSSPRSGPKRYDYVISGEGQNQKEDTAVGDWVYTRDGSTLGDLFLKELGIDLSLALR